jgi:hypothetical protein
VPPIFNNLNSALLKRLLTLREAQHAANVLGSELAWKPHSDADVEGVDDADETDGAANAVLGSSFKSRS